LLTGERAHYELAAGNGFEKLIRTYEAFSTCGQMLPEQVWDGPCVPETRLCPGKPADSAVPLVWAHAEYLKLLRSALDGKVFDRIDAVFERYCEPAGRQKLRRDVEISSFHRPIHSIAPGSTLRILDERQFELNWTTDAWQTTEVALSRSLGSAGFGADIQPGGTVEWTLHWPEQGAWLGYNVEVKVITD
jgi:glucoamylase